MLIDLKNIESANSAFLKRVTEVKKVFRANHEKMSWMMKCLIFCAWLKKNETKCSKRFEVRHLCIFPNEKIMKKGILSRNDQARSGGHLNIKRKYSSSSCWYGQSHIMDFICRLKVTPSSQFFNILKISTCDRLKHKIKRKNALKNTNSQISQLPKLCIWVWKCQIQLQS